MDELRRILWNGLIRTVAVSSAYVISAYLMVIAVMISLREPGAGFIAAISIVFSPLAMVGLLVRATGDLRQQHPAHSYDDWRVIIGFAMVFLITSQISLRRFSGYLRRRDWQSCKRCGHNFPASTDRCPRCGTLTTGLTFQSSIPGKGAEPPSPGILIAGTEPPYPYEVELIRRQYIDYLHRTNSPWRTKGFSIGVHLFFSAAAVMTLIGLPAGLIGFFLAWRTYRKAKNNLADWVAFAQRAVPIVVYPIMVNSMLNRPGTAAGPGLVVGSLDSIAGLSEEDMMGLVETIMEADAGGPKNPEQAWVASLLSDETYQPNRRRKFPESLTGPWTVYAFDLAIHPRLLKDLCIRELAIPCMAEPGDQGRIKMMPWQIGEILFAVIRRRGSNQMEVSEEEEL